MGRRNKYILLLLLAIPALAPAWAGEEDHDNKFLELSGNFEIPVTVNGLEIFLQVLPDAFGAPAINPQIAKAVKARSGLIGFGVQIGPARHPGRTAVLRNDYGFGEHKQRTIWFETPISKTFGGSVGPGGLPYKYIKFNLAEPTGNEAPVRFDLEEFGPFGLRGVGFYHEIAGQKIEVKFGLEHEESLVAATTGKLLADNYSGHVTGATYDAEIIFGVRRPVRRLTLQKSFGIQGRMLENIAVRVHDFGDATTISDMPRDDDEIVVTGKKASKFPHRLLLGRNFLKGCSSLSFDFERKIIQLECQPSFSRV